MLKWVFGADTGPFRRGLNQMRNDVKGFSNSIKGDLASALSLGAITSWAKAMIDQAGRIDDLSKRLDMTAESIQRIGYAAEQGGANIETVGKSLTKLKVNLADAAGGSEKMIDATRVLGLTLGDFQDMAPEDQLVAISDGYTKATDKGKALSAVLALMGKSGAELIPMLSDGPEELRSKMEEAKIASEAEIATLAKLGDQMDQLKATSLAAFGSIVSGFKMWGAYAEFALNKLGKFKGADAQLESRLDAIINGESGGSGKKDGQDAADKAEELVATEKERQKLAEEIAKLEEDSRMRQLSLEEQILALRKKQAELSADNIFGSGNEALEARKKELEITKEIEKLESDRADNEQKKIEDTEAGLRKIEELRIEGDKIDRENSMANMTREEKIAQLKKDQQKATTDALQAAMAGDLEKSLEKTNEGKQIGGEISQLEKTKDKAPTIMVEDLRKIGGGGLGALSSNPQAGVESRLDRAIKVMEGVEKNTRPGLSDRPRPF